MAPAVTDRPRDAKPPARSDLMRPENDGKLRFIPAGDMRASRFSMSASGIEKKAIAAATQAMANCIRAEFPQSERND